MVDDFQIDLKEPSSFRGTADARLAASLPPRSLSAAEGRQPRCEDYIEAMHLFRS